MFESQIYNLLVIAAIPIVIYHLVLLVFKKTTGKDCGLKAGLEKKKPDKHCKNCGFEGKPKSRPGGSTFWTMFWVIAFAPFGIIYWISRYGAPIYSCPKCKSENLIDTDSPILKQGA